MLRNHYGPVGVGCAERRRARVFLPLLPFLAAMIVALSVAVPVDGQTGGEESVEDLQAERERIRAAEIAKAREIDAANAEVADLARALDVLEAGSNARAADLEEATRQLETARLAIAAAREEVEATNDEIAELEARLGEQALLSFMDERTPGARSLLADVSRPLEAVRRQTMLSAVTQSDIDLALALRAAREDLEVDEAEAAVAVANAEALAAEADRRLATLDEDRTAQASVAAAAEDRLDHLLAERAALAQLGAEVDSQLPAEALADSLAGSSPAPTPPPSDTPAPTTAGVEVEYAGNGIYVHVDIVDSIRQLLADAAAAGVALAGGGYRDPAAQIATRRNNCGTSNYAIYEMPASQCSPPTARPGRSMHEQGRAIDFTYNGALIRSRSGGGWDWLRANAANYGLINLPSEPWHWSTNGR